jgi:hypothetical protein
MWKLKFLKSIATRMRRVVPDPIFSSLLQSRFVHDNSLCFERIDLHKFRFV